MCPDAPRRYAFALLFLHLLPLPPSCQALQATPDSDCASICVDSPGFNLSSAGSFHTLTTDLTCTDTDYNSTDKGQKFQTCNSCLRGSSAAKGDVNDQGALLHNIRATVDLCIWGFPNASSTVSSPCVIDYGCDPLKYALESSYSDVTFAAQYAYCTAANGSFLSDSLEPCIQCFQASTTQSYLANFLLTLQAACQQRPAPGRTLKIDGDIFSSTPVNITMSTATPTATLSVSGQASPALSTGGLIGIVLASLVVLVALCAVGFVCYSKRRRLADLKSRQEHRQRDSVFEESSMARLSTDSESTMVENESWSADSLQETKKGDAPQDTSSPRESILAAIGTAK